MDHAAQDYAITLLSSHTGAEVRGVDLQRPIDRATRDRLNRDFVYHSVLVISDQKLSAPEFLQAMQLFGYIFPQHNPRFQVPECPMIHYISNQDRFEDGTLYIPGEGYHTDHSNDAEPPKATALHAVKLPNGGGDTQFINMYEAYGALPEKTKKQLDALKSQYDDAQKHQEELERQRDSAKDEATRARLEASKDSYREKSSEDAWSRIVPFLRKELA